MRRRKEKPQEITYIDGVGLDEFKKVLSKIENVDNIQKEIDRLLIIKQSNREKLKRLEDKYTKKFSALETGKNYDISSKSVYVAYTFSGILLYSKDVQMTTDKDGAFEYFDISGRHHSLQEMENVILSYNDMKKDIVDVSEYINYYADIRDKWDVLNNKNSNLETAIQLLQIRINSIEKAIRTKAINKERKDIFKIADGFFKEGQTIYSYTYFPVTKRHDEKMLEVKHDGKSLYFEAHTQRWRKKTFPYNKKNVHFFYTHFTKPVYINENDDYGTTYLKVTKNYKTSKTDKFGMINISKEEYDYNKGAI